MHRILDAAGASIVLIYAWAAAFAIFGIVAYGLRFAVGFVADALNAAGTVVLDLLPWLVS